MSVAIAAATELQSDYIYVTVSKYYRVSQTIDTHCTHITNIIQSYT